MLILQTAGVLVGIALVSSMLRSHLAQREAVAAGSIVVPVAVSLVVATSVFWPTVKQFVVSARRDARVSDAQAAVSGGLIFRYRVDFLSWVQAEIPTDQSYYLLDGNSPGVQQWVGFQLVPRLVLLSPDKAQWIVLYGRLLNALGSQRILFGQPRYYSPGFGIVRRLDAR